jgi:protein gp37
MADNTPIEWADATVNAVNGCSVLSPGCKHCYAMKQAHRVDFRHGLVSRTAGGQVWTGEVYLHEKSLLQPLRWRRPRRIFWNAHGDLFHENVPDAWIDRVFAVCALTPQHTHMILTKRPERMREYVNDENTHFRVAMTDLNRKYQMHSVETMFRAMPLPNVWLGTSAEDQPRADERIPHLLATPAARRFVSLEPLLGPVDLTRLRPDGINFTLNALLGKAEHLLGFRSHLSGLDWVIVGGESGPGARPMHPDWARSLRDQCAAAGVPFFFKQWEIGRAHV